MYEDFELTGGTPAEGNSSNKTEPSEVTPVAAEVTLAAAEVTSEVVDDSATTTDAGVGENVSHTASSGNATNTTPAAHAANTAYTAPAAHTVNAANTGYGYRQPGETNRVNMNHIPEEPKKKPKKKGGFFKKFLICAALGIVFGVFFGAAIVGVKFIADKVNVSFSSDFKVGDNKDAEDTVDKIIEDAESAFDEMIPDKKGDKDKDADIAPPSEEKKVKPSENDDISDKLVTGPLDVSGVVEKCMPSIVAITNKYTETYQSIWGERGEIQNEASGSGIIVGQNEEELLIVTNSHVISDADELTVQFVDGESYDAEIKGSNSNEDLAIIAVKLTDMSDDTLDEISIAELGDSDSLKVGEPAIAIGNSLGYGQSVTSGIISALNRDFEYENGSKKVIQTDAAINPGNSGGALLNIKGEVIGINEAKYSSTSVEGVGYAIPISIAKPIIDNLVTKTTRSKVDEKDAAFLGIGGVDVTDSVASMYGMPVGIYINQVTEGSAAESAGLIKGDVITTFDGETVSSMAELKKTMEYYSAGTEVEIEVQRLGEDGYEELTIPVILGKRES